MLQNELWLNTPTYLRKAERSDHLWSEFHDSVTSNQFSLWVIPSQDIWRKTTLTHRQTQTQDKYNYAWNPKIALLAVRDINIPLCCLSHISLNFPRKTKKTVYLLTVILTAAANRNKSPLLLGNENKQTPRQWLANWRPRCKFRNVTDSANLHRLEWRMVCVGMCRCVLAHLAGVWSFLYTDILNKLRFSFFCDKIVFMLKGNPFLNFTLCLYIFQNKRTELCTTRFWSTTP
jgi:hypothetical protein